MKNGILIIDKPAGWTSHDVVAKLRGIVKTKRVGHGGTLDPMATGVLPIFIGRATRAAMFSENAEKEYIAGLRFGIVTDTQDITGRILSENECSVSADDLKIVLPRFLGQQKQIPPMYSAIKKDGKKLYELARMGIVTELEARDIEIKYIGVEPSPPGESSDYLYIKVICSKGTYVRTLCHDIGSTLGCGAALGYLRRTKAGVYDISNARTLDTVINDFSPEYLLPVDSIFLHYPHITLCPQDAKKAKNGAVLNLKGYEISTNGKYRVYSQEGEFLLFGEVINNELRTIKNFFEV